MKDGIRITVEIRKATLEVLRAIAKKEAIELSEVLDHVIHDGLEARRGHSRPSGTDGRSAR